MISNSITGRALAELARTGMVIYNPALGIYMSYAHLRQAVEAANVNHECSFDLQEHVEQVGGQPVTQLIVSYRSGNEYLRLDRLLENLGTVRVFEFRGRGAGDLFSLVADVAFDREVFQLIYRLPYERE